MADRILKTVVIHAPLERVWNAIADSRRFGAWFGARFDAPFTVGAQVQARIVPTTMDPEVARLQEPHRDTPFEIRIERIEPMRSFAFWWQACPSPPGEAPALTLVAFDLEVVGEGTRVAISESGFEAVPADRRAAVMAENDGGWEMQARLVRRFAEGGRPVD